MNHRPFRRGSTTKMLTGAAMLVLADQGRIELGAPIGARVTVFTGLYAGRRRATGQP